MPRLDIPVEAWVSGFWVSEVCDISRQSFPSSGDNIWGILRWFEENTSIETDAYVRVDILDSDGVVLQEGLVGSKVINNRRFNRSINVAAFNNSNTVDVRIRFKLFSLVKQPIVSNIELNSGNAW